MNLYVDDNLTKGVLVALLRRANQHGVLPADVGSAGASDPRHLIAAVQQDRALLTKDYDDFLDLHDLVLATSGNHAGILVICSDNDPTRDMKDRDIGRAIAKLENAGVPIASEFHVLNHWR